MGELSLIFVGGLLGSSHCLGMCGPFALSIGADTPSLSNNLGRQCVYSLGRIFTYATLGACAGFGGRYLHDHAPALINIAAILAVAAGLLLLYQGLLAARVIRRRVPSNPHAICSGEFLRTFLQSPGLQHVFLAGLFTGMLPCGLVYGFLALAAGSGDMAVGAMIMAVFGVGTVPLMVLTGCAGSMLNLPARKHLFRLAAWCVVLTGVVSIVRGVGFLELFGGSGCPMCQ